MNKQLKDMTEIEIKAFISDERDKIDISSQNVQILRSELQRRISLSTVSTPGINPVANE